MASRPTLYTGKGHIFALRGASHALRGIRYGVQAGLGNLFAALLAPAIAAVFNPSDCRVNLVEDAFVASEQGKCELLIGIVAAKLFPVGRYADRLGMVLQGIVFHVSYVTQKACPQDHEFFIIELQLGIHHQVDPHSFLELKHNAGIVDGQSPQTSISDSILSLCDFALPSLRTMRPRPVA